MRIAVLASHEGTILQAILDACRDGVLDAQVVCVISNNSKAGALQRARLSEVPTHHLSTRTHPKPGELDAAICAVLESAGTNLVFLGGYARKLGPLTLRTFAGRVLNTHPSLLPQFGGPGMYGMAVHQAVIDSGESVSGASIHLVTEEYDAGRVLAQASVLVSRADTAESLAVRVQSAERALIVETLGKISSGSLELA